MFKFITFARSLVFNILFAITNLVLCVGLLWALFIPSRYTLSAILIYFRSVYVLEKYILGLDYRVEGMENLPKDGSYIIAMKHQSTYETFKVFMIFGYVAIIMKRELSWIPLWGWYALKTKMIFVNRGAKGTAVQSLIKNAKPVIEQGRPILIYPQGTRVRIDETLKERPYKQGSIRLYENYDLPIVPVAMNSGLFWPKGSFIKKPGTVTFKIMPAIPAGLSKKDVLKEMEKTIERESNQLIKDAA
jgi:1-acyl-sn-glycerol-3-phosphate acyltransferase